MKHFIISKNSLQPSVWDGGKTYECFIYPPETTYAKRDFLFRISAASIEKIPSHFTRFENYQRFLVMLDNDLRIQRNSKKEHFKKEEIFSFDSNDEIISQTLGNDFNLMVAKEKVTASVYLAKKDMQLKSSFLLFFALHEVQIKVNQNGFLLNPNDLLVIENDSNIILNTVLNASVICCEIILT